MPETTRSVNELLKMAEQYRTSAAELEEKVKGLRNAADSALRRASDEIRSGDTTGDSIRDYVIVAHEKFGGVFYDSLKILSDRIKANIGRIVFVVKRSSHSYICRGPTSRPTSNDYVEEKDYYIGIIKEPGLVFPTYAHGSRVRGFEIACSRFVVQDSRYNTRILEGNLGQSDVSLNLPEMLHYFRLPFDNEGHNEVPASLDSGGIRILEVAIGDEAFLKHPDSIMHRRRDKILSLLGYKLEDSVSTP